MPQSAWKKDPSILQKDSSGNLWIPGNCQCGGTVAALTDDVMDAVFQGLHQLDHVLCAVLLQSFDLMIQIGENFIPAAGEINAIKAAVKTAKTMAENALGGSGLDTVRMTIKHFILFKQRLTCDTFSGSASPAASRILSPIQVCIVL